LRESHHSVCAIFNTSRKPNLALKVPLDLKTIDNAKTVQLTESANMAREATTSILPVSYLLSSTIATTVSQNAGPALGNVPTPDAMLQCSSNVCRPADLSTSVAQSDVLIITADQLEQLGFNAGMLPVVTAANTSQVDTTLLHCDKSEVPSNAAFSLNSAISHEVLASDRVTQPATTVVTTGSNLIGRAFASAVGISVDQLSSFADVEPDDNQWELLPPASTLVPTAAASVPGDVVYSISSIAVHDSEQSVAASVADVDISCAESSLGGGDLSPTTGPESGHIFARCDVDVSDLDITMLNSSLSPLPSQPCEPHVNNNSTLATPKKMECARDDETLTFAAAKIRASNEARMSPCGSGSAAVADSQYQASYRSAEVGISGVSSALPGSLASDVFTGAVSSSAVISTMSASGSVVAGLPTVISVAGSAPLPASPQPMSVGLPSFHQIPTHHMRSPLKLVPSNQRPIIPRNNEQLISSSKPISSFLSKPKPRKSKANVHAKPLAAIAPKAVVAKAYLSPVKQAAASIRARAKRLQSSPSRNVWYSSPRLKTAESSSGSVRPAINPSDVWTLVNDDDDEAASGDGEEQGTDVDSQLEDECEDDASAPSAEQSPSVYVEFLLFGVTTFLEFLETWKCQGILQRSANLCSQGI